MAFHMNIWEKDECFKLENATNLMKKVLVCDEKGAFIMSNMVYSDFNQRNARSKLDPTFEN